MSRTSTIPKCPVLPALVAILAILSTAPATGKKDDSLIGLKIRLGGHHGFHHNHHSHSSVIFISHGGAFRYYRGYPYRYRRPWDFNYGEASYSRFHHADLAKKQEKEPQLKPIRLQRWTRVHRREAVARSWAILAEGKDREARNLFDDVTHRHPHRRSPKVGHALATALLGDLTQGAHVMSRAMGRDPRALHDVVLNDQLRARINELMTKYDAASRRDPHHVDLQVMVASLHCILEDHAAARKAVDQAAGEGGKSLAVRKLRKLIELEMERK